MPTKTTNVLSWASDVEKAAIDQASRAASLPFVEGHVALMPDAHIGMGATIGSVISTRGAIIPAAVGVDIGCGVIAVESDLLAADLPDDLASLLSGIESVELAGLGKAHEKEPATTSIPELPDAVSVSDKQRATIAYALANRSAMMDAVLGRVWADVGKGTELERIDCHHNFTTRENNRGRNVWLTRKGAIRARVGDLGVIPGSIGTRSYIVEGLGSDASYQSCSHGAGRRMSRREARRSLTTESLEVAMAGKTWNASKARDLIDEHSDSYKDIDRVMADQADLVKVRHTLRQVLNYKGS